MTAFGKQRRSINDLFQGPEWADRVDRHFRRIADIRCALNGWLLCGFPACMQPLFKVAKAAIFRLDGIAFCPIKSDYLAIVS
jgi:hypothetical protein